MTEDRVPTTDRHTTTKAGHRMLRLWHESGLDAGGDFATFTAVRDLILAIEAEAREQPAPPLNVEQVVNRIRERIVQGTNVEEWGRDALIELKHALEQDRVLDVERLGFSDLLDVADAILRHYPPDTIVCSHLHRADIGARTVAAIADLVTSARLGSAPSRPEPDPLRPEHPYNGGTCCDQPEADHA